MKKFKLTALAIALTLLVGLPVLGWSGTIDDIKKRGVIRVGMDLEYPPVQFRDKNGEPTGFDVDVANMVANDLGVKIEIVDMKWDALIPALLSGKVDILWAGHTNTPERALAVWFSPRLEQTEVVLIVSKDETAKSLKEMDVEGKTITCLLGSTSEKAAKMIFQKAEIRSLPDQQASFMEVESGRASACITDLYQAAPYTRKHDTTKVLTDAAGNRVVVSREYGHAAMRKGDIDLYLWVYNWVDYYRAAGTLDALEDKWIGAFIRGEKTY